MKCPFCGYSDTAVKDSRAMDDHTAIRRRRHCLECNGRFSTVEHIQLLPLRIIKKSGIKQMFQREKLLRSFEVALHKRPVENTRIDRLVNSVIRQLESLGEIEIQSTVIGEKVMTTLQGIDSVAYVRYASVYKDFEQPADFHKFMTQFEQHVDPE